MPISLHKQATTTPKVRVAIQASDEPAHVLAAVTIDDIFALPGVEQGVVSIAPSDRIIAYVAIEAVVTDIAEKPPVVAGAAEEAVVSGQAEQRIGFPKTVDPIGKIAACKGIGQIGIDDVRHNSVSYSRLPAFACGSLVRPPSIHPSACTVCFRKGSVEGQSKEWLGNMRPPVNPASRASCSDWPLPSVHPTAETAGFGYQPSPRHSRR